MFSRIRKDEMIKGSLILMIMFGLFNLFNYLYQISMARMLGPSDYSIIAVIMSLIYIFGIPTEAIQTVVTRYTSIFNAKNNLGKIKDLLYRSLRKGFKVSLIMFAIFIPIAIVMSLLMSIDFILLVIVGLFIIYSFTSPVLRGVLQGRKKFGSMGLNMVIESLSKFLIAVLAVFFGLSVYGAVGGIILGGIIAFIAIFWPIKEITNAKRERENFKDVFSYNLPILLAMTAIILMYSLDVIIARMVFSPEISGKYAFVSLIGKTILFISFAIGHAMFPLASENFKKKRLLRSIFKKSMALVGLVSFVALALFALVPKAVIKIISFGDTRYVDSSNVLLILGVSFALASFAYIIILRNLSENKMKKSSWGLLGLAVLEAVLMLIFHSSIMSFSICLLAVNILLLVYSIFAKK